MSAKDQEVPVGAGGVPPATHTLSFDGDLLRRGFWLYVWEITTPGCKHLYYVGRTGDSSSANAQSPFNRMAQHLGSNERSNVLRRRLRGMDLSPELCGFRLVAHGPILGEDKDPAEHRRLRDVVAALERALAEALCAAGYEVINKVRCRMPLDEKRFDEVRAAFAAQFPKLVGVGGGVM